MDDIIVQITEVQPIKVTLNAVGAKGDQGVSISNLTINEENHLIVTLSDGTNIDTGSTIPQVLIDSINQTLATKVDREEGKGLSSNDYTTTEKDKLARLNNYAIAMSIVMGG